MIIRTIICTCDRCGKVDGHTSSAALYYDPVTVQPAGWDRVYCADGNKYTDLCGECRAEAL